MDKDLSVELTIAAIFYFEQIFLFCIVINKNVLEWFLLIMRKEYTLSTTPNLFNRNHLVLCF